MNPFYTTYREAYAAGKERLSSAGVTEAALDARLLLEYVCHTTHETLLAHGERALSDEEQEAFKAFLKQREQRIPLAYITGEQDFMGLPFLVTRDVLIPSPDTEVLVERALREVKANDRILDLCTGSGCVGLSLLKLTNDTSAVLTDCDDKALAVASKNAAALDVEKRTTLTLCDLFPEKKERFDLIVSNPPYIQTDVIDTLQEEVRTHTPKKALDGGADGLTFYRRMAEEAHAYLKPGGMLFTEIGYDEGEAAMALFCKAHWKDVKIEKDLAGNDRVVCARNCEVL